MVLFKLSKITDPETTTEQNNMFAISVQHDGVKMFIFFKIVGELSIHMWTMKFKGIEILETYSETVILHYEGSPFTLVFKNAIYADNFLSMLNRYK